MRSFNKKISFSLVIAGMLIALLLLVIRTEPMLASTRQSMGTLPPLLGAGSTDGILHIPQIAGAGGPFPWSGTGQQNNQLTHGAQEIKNERYFGSNQDNDGNQGFNTGITQDNSSNRGNLVTNQHRNVHVQLNHQVVAGSASSARSSNSLLLGTDQGNSGNTGTNLGNNLDSSDNEGNVVNNQGNVIGTQVNAPGTDVDNDGSTIQVQVVHRSWIPPVELQLQPFPGSRLTLKAGG